MKSELPHIRPFYWGIIAAMLLLFATIEHSSCQENTDYDEIMVYLSVENLGYFEMEALYMNDELFLPVSDMFMKLKIYTFHSIGFDTIGGYFGDESNSYFIGLQRGLVVYRNDTLRTKPNEMIRTNTDLFLQTQVLEKAFGFTLSFDFRSLTVFLHSDSELPVIKILRQEKIRDNLKQVKGEIVADTTLKRQYKIFSGSFIDWSIQLQQKTSEKPLLAGQTSIGSELLGGELNVRLNFNNISEATIYNLSVRWRWVNNSSKIVKQAELAVFSSPLYSQVNSPLIGFGIKNTPTVYRKSYGTYTLQGKTTPGWEIEAYVNNVLIDYTTADANGEYNFDIPLVYGNTLIVLKKYGPWGEEEIEEQNMSIPYVFVPEKQIDYQIYSGFTFDSLHQAFAFGKVSYGLNRKSTIGVGYEYFENNTNNPGIPFMSASAIFFRKFLTNYLVLFNASQQLSAGYRLNNGISIESQFRYFSPDQDVWLSSTKNDLTGSFTLPFKIKKTRFFFKNSFRRIETAQTTSFSTEGSVSVFFKRFNIAGFSSFSLSSNQPSVSGGLNTSYSFKRQWTVYSQLSADISNAKFTSARIQLQKRLSPRVYFSSSAIYDFNNKATTVTLNAFINLNAIRVGYSAQSSQNNLSGTLEISGNVIFGGAVAPISLFNRSMTGKCGIDAMVFLDTDFDEIRDSNEPLLTGITIGISKGQQVITKNDSVYRFMSLEPYTPYILSISDGGMQNISWILKYKTLAVYPDPNTIRKVYIPVHPMGEVSGNISYIRNGKQTPASRINILFIDQNGKTAASVLSEDDGYFDFLGLAPGNYIIKIDPQQLNAIGCISYPAEQSITIQINPDGDYIDGIEFQLVK